MAPHPSQPFDLLARLSKNTSRATSKQQLDYGQYLPADLASIFTIAADYGFKVESPVEVMQAARQLADLQNKIKQLEARNELLEQQNITDTLTGISNRRYLLESLTNEVTRVNNYNSSAQMITNYIKGYPLSFLFFDLDHFKSINDTYGHQAGDCVLKQFAGILSTNLRPHDTAGRYGGEEFAIILPETTIYQAEKIAKRINNEVAETTFSIDKQVTVSGGVTEFSLGDTTESLIERADKALYSAKHSGRNRIESSMPPSLAMTYASFNPLDNIVASSVLRN